MNLSDERVVQTAPVADERQADFWENYDPARLRAVIRRNAEMPDRATPAEVERIIADIRTLRGQDSKGWPASPFDDTWCTSLR